MASTDEHQNTTNPATERRDFEIKTAASKQNLDNYVKLISEKDHPTFIFPWIQGRRNAQRYLRGSRRNRREIWQANKTRNPNRQRRWVCEIRDFNTIFFCLPYSYSNSTWRWLHTYLSTSVWYKWGRTAKWRKIFIWTLKKGVVWLGNWDVRPCLFSWLWLRGTFIEIGPLHESTFINFSSRFRRVISSKQCLFWQHFDQWFRVIPLVYAYKSMSYAVKHKVFLTVIYNILFLIHAQLKLKFDCISII